MDFWDELSDRYKNEQGGTNWSNLMGDTGQFAHKNGYENQGMWSGIGKALDSGNNPRSDTPEPPRIEPPNPYRQASAPAQPAAAPAPMAQPTADVGATRGNAQIAMAGMDQEPRFEKMEPYKQDNSWIGAVLSMLV